MKVLLQEYSERVQRLLGHPTVNVELSPEQLDECVNLAFLEIEPYIDDTQFITVPYANRIDLTEYKVSYITNLHKSPVEFDPLSPTSFDYGYYTNLEMDLPGIMAYYASRQLTLSLKDRMGHKFIPPYLYLDVAPPIPPMVTIEYAPRIESVDDVKDNVWIALIMRLALANAKEVLGRIRGKARVQSSPVELDGDTLLNEANNEKSEIREALKDISFSFFPTD